MQPWALPLAIELVNIEPTTGIERVISQLLMKIFMEFRHSIMKLYRNCRTFQPLQSKNRKWQFSRPVSKYCDCNVSSSLLQYIVITKFPPNFFADHSLSQYCSNKCCYILCLTSRTTVTSARIPEEDNCHRARNLCVFSHVLKGTLGLTHKGWVLQRVFLGTLSDVTIVLGMRQSIVNLYST